RLVPPLHAHSFPTRRSSDLNRDVLKEMAVPMLAGTFIGAIVGVVSGVLMAKWVNFDAELVYSITPKSVTTPVAMDISSSLGGIRDRKSTRLNSSHVSISYAV